MSAPPTISAIWFPPEERTLATCINLVCNLSGNILGFLVGPAMVPDVKSRNTTISEVKEEIQAFLGLEAGIGVVLLLAFIIYFPNQPPTPPSASASIERTNFKEGLKTLINDKNIILCTFANSFSGVAYGSWQVILFFY